MQPSDKTIQFCTKQVEYPKEGYAVILYLINSEKQNIVYPHSQVFPTKEHIKTELLAFRKDMQDSHGVTLFETCLLMPVFFEADFPLRPEFWEHPDTDYTHNDRRSTFLAASVNAGLHKLLVTPSKTKKEGWQHLAALAFPVSTPMQTLEQFMMTSNWPVEETAKNAAIYTFGEPRMYDWLLKQETGAKINVTSAKMRH